MEEQIEERDDKDKDYDLPDEGCFPLFVKLAAFCFVSG